MTYLLDTSAVLAHLRKEPGAERLPLVDALIASAARSREAILVHRDAHMRALPATMVAQLDLES